MIEKAKGRKNYYNRETIIKEVRKSLGKDDVSADDVLKHILGDYDGYNVSDYVLYRYDDIPDKTFWNRLNMCWFYPIFICTIPFQWLIKGDAGINRNSKIGKIVDKLIKF